MTKVKLESDFENSKKEFQEAESEINKAKDKIQQNDKGTYITYITYIYHISRKISNDENKIVITYLNKQLNQFPNLKSENRIVIWKRRFSPSCQQNSEKIGNPENSGKKIEFAKKIVRRVLRTHLCSCEP